METKKITKKFERKVILMKKMLFIDEITKESFEECLELQDRFLINDKEDIFFFRITRLSDGRFILKIYQEDLR